MQLASRGECDRAREGRSLVDFEGIFFFLLYFRKKLCARATRNKENYNSGLMKKKNRLKVSKWSEQECENALEV